MAASNTTTSNAVVTMDVFRYEPDASELPRMQRYTVPFREDWVVLDALNHIKDEIDGTLSFRWSCRMGVCGSCGMMVNGEPRLTCNSFLRDYYPNPIRVEPLSYFPVIRDLIINLDHFLDKLEEVKAWLIPAEDRELSEGEYRQSPAQLAQYKQFSMCINCMLCYAACPAYGHHSEFIGPAALALAQRYNMDSRDGASDERADVIFSEEGIWDCTFVGECARVCPKNVDPASAIQQAKVEATKDFFKSVLVPWGKRQQPAESR
ncbi:MAG: succinate dehydrogenase/fumarate reductase iron-sulfur subunit [Planctomycetaceae bacterium]|nr:succinate dehydrogenase/fumarate reductase iron-sulfur subunit [Planctomycetaceae bacterium]